MVSDFKKLLQLYFQSDALLEDGLPSVRYFSEKLNYSTYYLSDLLKSETGKTTQDHIHDFLIKKAKDALLDSELSVSEIAYSFGFSYPNYFGKLFKKKTGLTPLDYRNSN